LFSRGWISATAILHISIVVFTPVFAHWLFDSLSLDLKPDIPELIDRFMGE
jgi:hypothetical protein